MSSLSFSQKDLLDIKEKFEKEPTKFSDLSEIFFYGQCKFFERIEKEHSSEGEEFIKNYKSLQNLALSLENTLKVEDLPVLETNSQNKKIELTRKQVALLFLLSFFNCIPSKYTIRFKVYNILNWDYRNFEFGRCFLNYLITIGKWLQEDNKILEEKIIYIRNSIEKSEEYLKDIDLCEVKFDEEISMFDGDAPYHVDFANKRIGGGALTGGRVQEEILFAKEPEAIVSMLFMEVMSDNDAIGIFNTIEYSQSTGYANSFKFKQSNITDDLSTVKKHRIIAIDASINRFYNYFYKNTNDIIRDIHKAYVGFNLINLEENKNIEKIIATGNWGCGAFGGNHELKFIQQWLAASFVGVKRLDYYTFKEKEMQNAVKYYEEIKNKYKNALKLYEAISHNKINENYIIINLIKNKIK